MSIANALGKVASKIAPPGPGAVPAAGNVARKVAPARGAGVAGAAGAGAKRVAPRAPAPVQRGGGAVGGAGAAVGGGSYGSTSTGIAAPMSMPAPEPAPVQLGEDEWRAQDSSYLGEESSLKMELDRALAQLRDQRTNYQTDFGKSARNLGWNWQDANNNGLPDDDELQAGAWNRDDQQGAYGQAYKNQQDDFVGRGMMDSTFYADAQQELDRGFTRQYDDMSGARNSYLKQLTGEETAAQDTHGAALQRARAEASARRAAQYGL